MKDTVSSFSVIAPYIKDPLVLIGFFVFLAFLFARFLVGKGITPTLSQKGGYLILDSILLYEFVIRILLIVVGFILKYQELRHIAEKPVKEAAMKAATSEVIANITSMDGRLTYVENHLEPDTFETILVETRKNLLRLLIKV